MNAWRSVLFILWLSVSGAALAAPDASNSGLGNAASEVSMDQAVRIVEQRYHARVVKAESRKDNGRTTYVLKLLNDAGKVWTVHVDAASGAVQ